MSCICNRCPAYRPPVERYPIARTYLDMLIVMRPDNAPIWVGIGWTAKQQRPDTLRLGDVTEWGEVIEIVQPGALRRV